MVHEWATVLVLVLAGAGLALLALDVGGHRGGATLLAAALLTAAGLRAALPARWVGMLAVRSRAADAVTAAALGVALLVIALLTPDA
ncbi:DUF3017 domain-containing protein [Motilibacter aurantiacus]|uniref:DUF3017 domain-containing protein n=1 Tax=Motilibacter aurantiacus TaxID=2714955 RepID=UPI00140748F6|nr:DUF3017 domain-containing protein [Motilibacter aurantiacus]NHC43940.1 DUF3017 domain-containing protein [Motilibacter aurantiacus]